MIINTVADAQIHSHLNEKGLIDMHIRPILGNGILSGIACAMTSDQARDFAETLIRLAGAADDAAKEAAKEPAMINELDAYIAELGKSVGEAFPMSGRFTAEGEPIAVIMNDRQVTILPGMTADVGNTGPGAYDFITYKGFEIIGAEDKLSDQPGCHEYKGPFYIGPDLYEVPDIEAAKKFLDEKLAPISATMAVAQNNPTEMTLTISQVITLHNKWNDEPTGRPFREFLSTVIPVFGGDGAVTVPWCGMHLCISSSAIRTFRSVNSASDVQLPVPATVGTVRST